MSTLRVLYLRYSRDPRLEGFAAIRRVHARAFSEMRLHLLVIDNAPAAPSAAALPDDIEVIDGDNRCGEFSGWDKGWRFLEEHSAPGDDDIVLLINDTFTRDPEFQDFVELSGPAVRQWLSSDLLAGHVDGLAEDICVFGVWQRRWIKSNFVLMSPRAMRALVPLSLDEPDPSIFGTSTDNFFVARHDLSANYRELVVSFLEGRPNIALWRWHRATRFTAENLPACRLKARAILCEQRLSARAKTLGFGLQDISRPRFPSKAASHLIRYLLFRSGLWRLVPRFRARFL